MKSSTWKLNISPSGNVFSIQVLSWSDLGTEDDGFLMAKMMLPTHRSWELTTKLVDPAEMMGKLYMSSESEPSSDSPVHR